MAVGAAIAATFAKIAASAIVKKIAINLAIAVATTFVAKQLGLFKPPKIGKQNDPGTKVQLPPSTDNKVPLLYGRNLAGGIITHAELVNNNQTMRYVIVLSEQVGGGTANYSVNRVFRNDVDLTVDNLGIVTGGTTRDGDSVTDIANQMRVYVYEGGTAAEDQIFPVTQTPAAATQRTGELNANTSMEGLVYAIFEINYDPEANLFDLGVITVDLENDVTNPADVFVDYLTNDRYGAGLAADALDPLSFDAFRDHCDQEVTREDNTGTQIQAPRWRLNGGLSTFDTALENITLIAQSSSAWFTYDPALGKYSVKISAEATQSEEDNAFQFDDNNIVSKVDVSTTELYSLYNEVEAVYQDLNLLDQTNVIYVKTPSNQLKPGEPDNTLRVDYVMVNDLPRARNLGNIELRQSRFDKVVRFTADYSAIQLLSGDFFALTNANSGFSEKLFRCVRTIEKEDDEGRLLVEVTGIEYDDSIYDHSIDRESNNPAGPGIPIFINNPNLGNIRANAIANIANAGFQVGQIPSSVISGLDANLAILNDLPGELANLDANLQILEGDLITLDGALSNNTNAINTLNTVTLPGLQSDLDQAELDIANNDSELNTLNTVTLPGLQSDLSNLDSELTILDSELDNVQGLFPITETSIASNAITTPKIIAGAVTTDKMVANTILGNRILTNSLDAGKIVAGSITTDRMTANTIDGDRITTNTLNANRITAGTITTDRFTANTINGNVLSVNTMNGDRIVANTINGNTIIANTMFGDRIIANTLSGNTLIANTVNGDVMVANTIFGNAIVGNTVTADKIFAANVSSITTNTGTLFVDTLKTADSNIAQRIELTGIQDDATYALWSGANAKVDANASFFVKHNGDAKFSGRVRAAQLEGSVLEAVPINVTGGPTTNATSTSYVTIRNTFGEVLPQSSRPVRPFVMITVPVFGEGSPGAFLQAQISVETSPGVFSAFQTVSQEISVNTSGFGSTATLAGGLSTFGELRYRFRVQMRRFAGVTYTGSPQANRYNGIFLGLPAGNGVNYQVEDAGLPFQSPPTITANTAVLIPPDFGTGWEIAP